jgi:L-fuculose-phosphate aldolase
MEENIDQLKGEFVAACRILFNEGLAQAQFSLSCRLDNNRMLINDNISPSLVTRENILTSPIDGEVVTGNVHPAIYRAREDVNAIVHAHPLYAIVLSTIDEEFIPIHNYGVIFHGKIKVYKSHGQVKTRERAEEIAKLLGDGRAILQRGHGTVVVGRDLMEAVLGTIYLEEAAKIHFLAKQMGTPQYISMELSAEITEQVFKERPKKRAWDHYVSKLK